MQALTTLPIHPVNTLLKALATHAEPPSLGAIELNTLLTTAWTGRPCSIAQQDTIIALRECILQTPTDTLIGVNARKQQRLDALLLQETRCMVSLHPKGRSCDSCGSIHQVGLPSDPPDTRASSSGVNALFHASRISNPPPWTSLPSSSFTGPTSDPRPR